MAQAETSTGSTSHLTTSETCAWPSCDHPVAADSIFCVSCLGLMARRREEFQERLMADADGRTREFLVGCGIPERYRLASPETIKLLPQKYVALAREYADRRCSLFLYGLAGSGKTFFGAAVLRKIIERDIADGIERGELVRPNVIFLNVPAFLSELRGAGVRAAAQRVKGIIGCRMAMLDDLGAERLSDWTGDVLYQIVNGRYNADRPIIVTSNLTLDELRTQFHDRLSSRLFEMCSIVAFPKRDLRMEIR